MPIGLCRMKTAGPSNMDVGLLIINLLLIGVLLLASLLTLIGLPGNWLIFLAAAGYGYWQQFTSINGTLLLLLFGLLLLGEVVEFAAGAWGAKKEKASLAAMAAASLGGVAGGLLGTALLPVIGSLLGAFGGAFLASYGIEYWVTGNREKSVRVGKSVLAAQAAGMVIKTAIAIAMVVTLIGHLSW